MFGNWCPGAQAKLSQLGVLNSEDVTAVVNKVRHKRGQCGLTAHQLINLPKSTLKKFPQFTLNDDGGYFQVLEACSKGDERVSVETKIKQELKVGSSCLRPLFCRSRGYMGECVFVV